MWTQILVHTVKKLLKHFSRKLKETTFVVIGALRVKIEDLPTSIQLEMIEICLKFLINISSDSR